MINNGFKIEEDLEKALNNSRFKNLSNNLKTLINQLFGNQNGSAKIQCRRTDNFIKPDLAITCDGKTAFVSVKSGHAQCVHTENTQTFIRFLKSLNVTDETLKTILYFQYGDGTLDGTGEKRMNYHKTFNWLCDRIKKANSEFECKQDVVEKVLDRLLFQGVDITADCADYIYYGDVDFGIVVSKRQIFTHLRRKSWSFYENLHIGPIMLKPHARYADHAIVSDDRRHQTMFYWPNFSADLEYIQKRYNF